MMLLYLSREARIKRSLPAQSGQNAETGSQRVSNAQLFEKMGFKRKIVQSDGTVVVQ